VIVSVEITGFRGIHEGRVSDLPALAVLVGPNGSGKSTLIEAVLIGSSPLPADANVQVIRRHEAGGAGLRWLFWKGGEAEQTRIRIGTSSGEYRECQLALDRGVPHDQTRIFYSILERGSQKLAGHVLGIKNTYHSHSPAGFLPLDPKQAYPRAAVA
jgi:predicted ATPase